MWAGDRISLKALDERDDFFSLKFRYRGEELLEARSPRRWGEVRFCGLQ